ncbi:MAG TPA: hypothetical protein VGM88_21460 [Kofleriaceae bacterium]
MNTMVRIFALSCLLTVACASGGTPNGNGDDTPTDASHGHDAAGHDSFVAHDAAPSDSSHPADASHPVDASHPADAVTLPDGNSGFLCTTDADCGSGQCCFEVDPQDGINFCVDGTDLFGVCFPSGN